MKHNYIKLMLPVLLCFTSHNASAHDFEVNGIYYNITSNEDLTVAVTYRGYYNSDYSDEYSGHVSIPEKVVYNEKTYRVTSIGNYAFSGCSGLTSVSIPNSLTSIGISSFEWCSNLTSFTIHDSVTSIGDDAFKGCSSLTYPIYNATLFAFMPTSYSGSFNIPDGIVEICGSAFCGCSGLTSITIPNSVKTIGSSAFSVCNSLTFVAIPNGVTTIGNNAFDYCLGLTSVTIGNSVTSIGDCAFRNCSSLTSITIPNSITNIGANAFYNCSRLSSLTIGNSVTSMGVGSFRDCSSLTSVTIPNSVTSLGEVSFSGCTSLISVTIGTGITSIESRTFYGTNLKKTIWLTNTPPSGWTNAKGSINYVSNNEFGSSNDIIVYPFLSSMFDVDGVKYVPVSPSDRTCDAIDCVYDETVTEVNIKPTVTYKGVNMKVLNVQPYSFYENINLQKASLDIAGGLGKYVFYKCNNLKSAVLGDNITDIDEYVFSECSMLEDIIIPDSVKAIGQYAFSNCSNMTSVIIGNGTETIGQYAFSGCSGIPTITIPGVVTRINNYAFTGCNGLKEVIIADREDKGNLTLGSNGNNPLFVDCPLDSVYIGGNITYQKGSNYGYSPFYRNTSLRSVMITDMEEEISENEFYGCTSLQNVEIGDGITEIGNRAFSGCASLQHFGFGTQVKSIGAEAFSDCTALTAIISKAATPPVCGLQALDDVNKWSCTLTVPKGSMEAYQTTDQWKDFFFVKEGDENGSTPIDPSVKKCAKPTISYTAGKLTFSSETEGATCMSTITDSDINSYSTNEVQLSVTYNISVYATKTGYDDSDAATATLCWIDVEPNTEGIDGGTASVRALPVLIQSHDGVLTIDGATEGTPISVYNAAGQLVGTATASTCTTTISTTLHNGNVGIVRIGDKAVKVMVK